MVKQNKKLSQNPAQPRKRDIMSKEDATFEAKVVQNELKEHQEDLNTTLLNKEDKMVAEFNDGEAKEPRKKKLLTIKEAILKFEQVRHKRILKILKNDLEQKTIKASWDCLNPQIEYYEPYEQDIIAAIAEDFENCRKFFPIIIDSYGRVLLGNTFYYVAEILERKKLSVIKTICLQQTDIEIYWEMLQQFARELGSARWDFLRMQLDEFNGIGL